MKVGIVGLGLIGGSLARDLVAAGNTVVGYDRSRATVLAARRAGIDARLAGADLTGIAVCEICVLAVPVTAAPAVLERAVESLARVACITDVGSTKRSIVRAAERLGLGPRFIGSHPLSGDTRAGWRAARTHLFADVPVFLTPGRLTRAATVAHARRLWRSVGGKPRLMTATAHDAVMAGASHLPQVVSSALGLTLRQLGIKRTALGRGGLDTTRLAGADPEVWTAIALDNADRIVPLLARYERAIRRARSAIESADSVALRALFRDSASWSRRR